MSDIETTTTIKLENVCPHGLWLWVGQGVAPCPFCHPECYQAGEILDLSARLSEAERERDEAQAQLAALREKIRALEAWVDPPEPGARHAAVWTEDIKAWCRDALGIGVIGRPARRRPACPIDGGVMMLSASE